MRRMTRKWATVAVLWALLVPATAVPSVAHEIETLRYSWSLGGFFGTLARLFLPGRGDGALTTRAALDDNVEVVLDITAPSAARGEFWRYGAAIDREDGRTLRAWSAYRFRGEDKSESSDLEDQSVIDVASGILLLRRERPTKPRNLKIWNDGKLYPVVILPRGRVVRQIHGKPYTTEHYAIRARRVRGERVWKGKLDIYLANDERATPVEISLERRMARVRLELDQ